VNAVHSSVPIKHKWGALLRAESTIDSWAKLCSAAIGERGGVCGGRCVESLAASAEE
jgi:hypothetical protein